MSIRTDHGREFENQAFREFCDANGIDQNFLTPRTPRQNGVVNRKYRVLIGMARTMLNEKVVLQVFWVDTKSTRCYISNRTILGKIPYEL